jgi:hypothetical protein
MRMPYMRAASKIVVPSSTVIGKPSIVRDIFFAIFKPSPLLL